MIWCLRLGSLFILLRDKVLGIFLDKEHKLNPERLTQSNPAFGCFPTTEGLLVELHEVGEDIFGDGFLVGQTLEQDDHLCLADGVHAFSRHVPTLPVYI